MPPVVVRRKTSAVRQVMPNTSMPSATPPIRSTNKCASGARSSLIPTLSTGRRSRPPSTRCPTHGSRGVALRGQNRRQAPIERAAASRLRSTALLRRSVCVWASSVAATCPSSRKLGCASSAPSSPESTIRPRQSIAASAGRMHFNRFLDDGRLCMSNNAAERELRAAAVGRRKQAVV